MTKVKLCVGLKIPDTTAITAFHTLERMGFNQLKKLEREDYYEFDVKGDEENFAKQIVKVDIVVNANKNYSKVYKGEMEQPQSNYIVRAVIVSDTGNKNLGLLSTLKERMGFSNLNAISKGVLWRMHIDAKVDLEAEEIATKITKDLLYNENYQEYRIV